MPKSIEEIGARFDPRLCLPSPCDFPDTRQSKDANDTDQGLGQRKQGFPGFWPQTQFSKVSIYYCQLPYLPELYLLSVHRQHCLKWQFLPSKLICLEDML